MKVPATLHEFYRTFPSERRCWEALRRLRWPGGFRCPRCAGRKAHRLRAHGPWQCAASRYQASLTAGTPFHGTRVPLQTWFLAMFFVARHKQASRESPPSSSSATRVWAATGRPGCCCTRCAPPWRTIRCSGSRETSRSMRPTLSAVESTEARGCRVYAPPMKPRDAERNPYRPLPEDSEAVARWRRRMGAASARAKYKDRAATAECVNAQSRNRGLWQFNVRGRLKARCVSLLQALAHNAMRGVALEQALQEAPSGQPRARARREPLDGRNFRSQDPDRTAVRGPAAERSPLTSRNLPDSALWADSFTSSESRRPRPLAQSPRAPPATGAQGLPGGPLTPVASFATVLATRAGEA